MVYYGSLSSTRQQGLVLLMYDDHLGNRPWMVAKFQGPTKDGEEVRWLDSKAPFEEAVGDS